MLNVRLRILEMMVVRGRRLAHNDDDHYRDQRNISTLSLEQYRKK